MIIQKQVGHRLRELRTACGLSQEKFALAVGLDRTYITSVEGGRRNISIVNLSKIWTYLHITPKEFFDSDIFTPGGENDD